MWAYRSAWLAVWDGSRAACLRHRPLQFRYSSSSSGQVVAPSYSSTGSLANIVTKLGQARISTHILTGQPNRPFPEQAKVDIDAMFEGGKQAVGVVTESLARGEDDLTSLEGLVSRECLAGLRTSLSQLQEAGGDQRALLHVHPEDVFFTFIPDFKSSHGRQTLLLVTFSLPGLSGIREKLDMQRQMSQQFDEEIKKKLTEVKEGHLDKQTFGTVIREEITEAEQKWKEIDPFTTFQQAEIVIGNWRFERPSPDVDWTIVEMSQINSVEAWAWPFRRRWKGRLGISLRGYSFNKVLRFDYITDWIALIFVSNWLFTSLLIGDLSGGGVGGFPPR